MKRYRLVRSERRTMWTGDGVSILRENPETLEEGTLEEVIRAAVEEVWDTLEWEEERGDLCPGDRPPLSTIRRNIGREVRLMAESEPATRIDLPLDSEGFWCLTLEEVETN